MLGVDAAGALVLVVDDDRTSARAIAEAVTSFGHNSVIANTWTEALTLFERRDFDLVLMDAVLPGVDGFRLTQLLRARARTYVPILFVTGLHEMRAKEHGLTAGADDFLVKPVQPLELQVRMTAMLRIRRLTLDLEAKRAALERVANVDALTGVPNRRQFDARMDTELDRCRRYSHPLAVIMLDIDHFKRINDMHGHPAGDEILRRLGQLLIEKVRHPDMAFRMGGEEFVVIAPETTAADAAALADRLRVAFAEATAGCRAGSTSMSCGVSATDLVGATSDRTTLLRTADEAMYDAKRTGRNRVCLYLDPRMRAETSRTA